MDTVSPLVSLSHRRAGALLVLAVLASFALALLASVATGPIGGAPPQTPDLEVVAPFRWLLLSPRIA